MGREYSLVGLKPMTFLSAAIGQRPRNYLSCCCCCSSPFGSIPHLNKLKFFWTFVELNPGCLDDSPLFYQVSHGDIDTKLPRNDLFKLMKFLIN